MKKSELIEELERFGEDYEITLHIELVGGTGHVMREDKIYVALDEYEDEPPKIDIRNYHS